ncbi:hypothetical protein D3C76_1103130 [compost metagenome]
MGDILLGQRRQWAYKVALQRERCRTLSGPCYPAPASFDGIGHLSTADTDVIELPRQFLHCHFIVTPGVQHIEQFFQLQLQRLDSIHPLQLGSAGAVEKHRSLGIGEQWIKLFDFTNQGPCISARSGRICQYTGSQVFGSITALSP